MTNVFGSDLLNYGSLYFLESLGLAFLQFRAPLFSPFCSAISIFFNQELYFSNNFKVNGC